LRTIAHISDLHFGQVNSAILPALTAAITAAKPNLVAVSGDLTQRARAAEFSAARQFLETLPKPQIVVPGNHDVPLYDLISRWRTPFEKYRRYINEDLEPFFADDEIAVLGINTARSLTFKSGRINAKQIAKSCSSLGERAEEGSRILVTHHPFDVADHQGISDVVGRADMAMAEFARCRIDVILTGHLHSSRISSSGVRYRIPGYSALFIQAGTATSVRQRGELNAWNLIRIEKDRIAVDCLAWGAETARFAVLRTEHYRRTRDGWSEINIDSSDQQNAS
jgi:3',5'-cyclic AMP phosphodiesterase CpdA